MNSAPEFKIYSPVHAQSTVQRERQKKAGVPVRGKVEPRLLNPPGRTQSEEHGRRGSRVLT